jgi:hypothetical protein
MVKAEENDGSGMTSEIVAARDKLQTISEQLTLELEQNQMKAVLGTLNKLISKRQKPTSAPSVATKKKKVAVPVNPLAGPVEEMAALREIYLIVNKKHCWCEKKTSC